MATIFILVPLIIFTRASLISDYEVTQKSMSESGNAVFQTIQTTCGSSCVDLIFLITYKKAYKQNPHVITAFHSIEYCPSANYYYMMTALRVKLSDLTQFKFTGYITAILNRALANLKVRYFAFSKEHPNFYPVGLDLPSPSTMIKTVDKSGVNQSSVHIKCFSYHLAFKSITSPFQFNIKCYALDTNNIFIQITNNNIILQYLWMVILVISTQNTLNILIGTMSATSSQYPVLSVTPSLQDLYFIGLIGFEINNCFNIGLDSTNFQISTSSTFNKLIYNYFIVKKNHEYPLSLIISYPHQNRILFKEKSIYKLFIDSLPIFNTKLNYVVSSSNPIEADIISPITNQNIILNYNTQSYNLQINLQILTAKSIKFNSLTKTIEINLINVYTFISENNLQISSELDIVNFQQSSLSFLELRYSSNIIGQEFFIQILHPDIVLSKVYLKLSSITKVQTTFNSNLGFIIIQNLFHEDVIIANNNQIKSTNFNFIEFISLQPEKLNVSFSLLNNIELDELVFGYIDPVSQFQTIFNLPLAGISKVQKDGYKKTVNISISNIIKVNQDSLTQFVIKNAQLIPIQIEINNNQLILIADATNYYNQQFVLEYCPHDTNCCIVINKVKHTNIVFESISFDTDKNNFQLVFENTKNITDIDELLIVFRLWNTMLVKKIVVLDKIILYFQYQRVVLDTQIKITLDLSLPSNDQRQFIIPFPNHFATNYCVFYTQQFLSRSKHIWIISVIISSLYILVFLFSIISSRKMYGIELIYLIQLSFYSLIPLNVMCDTFSGLSGLKYSSGATPVLWMLQQKPVIPNLQILNIYSNFLTNANILIVLIFIIPLIYFPMKFNSERSKDKHTKPCCLKYGKAMLHEFTFVVVLFNCFNIYTSAVVNFQTFGTSNIMSLIISIICTLIPPATGIVFFKFRQEYKQFQSEFDPYSRSKCFSIQDVTKIRKTYPLILLFEMILVPLLLSIQIMFKVGIYIVLFLEILITVYVCIIPLYIFGRQNLRNYFHRAIVLSICVLQIITLNLKNNDSLKADSIVFWQPIALLILLFLGFLCTGVYTFVKCIQYWKSPEVIDYSLQKSTQNDQKTRKKYEYSYPISPFSKKTMIKPNPSHLQNKPPLSNYVQRVQKWFDQIQTDNLFLALKIKKQNYFRYRQIFPDCKYYYIRKMFWFLPQPIQTIKNNSSKIVRLSDFLNLLDSQQLFSILQNNRLDKGNYNDYKKQIQTNLLTTRHQ